MGLGCIKVGVSVFTDSDVANTVKTGEAGMEKEPLEHDEKALVAYSRAHY